LKEQSALRFSVLFKYNMLDTVNQGARTDIYDRTLNSGLTIGYERTIFSNRQIVMNTGLDAGYLLNYTWIDYFDVYDLPYSGDDLRIVEWRIHNIGYIKEQIFNANPFIEIQFHFNDRLYLSTQCNIQFAYIQKNRAIHCTDYRDGEMLGIKNQGIAGHDNSNRFNVNFIPYNGISLFYKL